MKIQALTAVVLSLLLAACSGEAPESAGSHEESHPVSQDQDAEFAAEVARVHDNLIVIDTHIDIPFNFATEAVDPGRRGDNQVDLPKMREGGLHVGFFVVWMPQTERTAENYATAQAQSMTKFDAIHRMTQMYPEQIELAYSADDLVRIHQSGKLVAMIGIENGYAIGQDLSLIEKYAALGARYMTLAHVGHNDISDSSMPMTNIGDAAEEHAGISDFGRRVIEEMNRTGIAVDISHISTAAALAAIAHSKAPVIASHSSVKGVYDHARNMTDAELLALRDNGGVVQIVAFDSYLQAVPEAKTAALNALLREYGLERSSAARELEPQRRDAFVAALARIHQQWPRASVSTLVDHIDYAVELIGIEHVGISSDFQGGGGIDGWDDASETKNVTAELLRRGYTEQEIRKLWGENTLRLLRDVEAVAAELSATLGTG